MTQQLAQQIPVDYTHIEPSSCLQNSTKNSNFPHIHKISVDSCMNHLQKIRDLQPLSAFFFRFSTTTTITGFQKRFRKYSIQSLSDHSYTTNRESIPIKNQNPVLKKKKRTSRRNLPDVRVNGFSRLKFRHSTINLRVG